MENLKTVDTPKLYEWLLECTRNFVAMDKEKNIEKKVEYAKEMDEILTEINSRKQEPV